MSGIAGIIHFDARPVEPGLIESMTSAMVYRGPNGINHWYGDGVALGHCMLESTTESLEERQPLQNEGGNLLLVFDGRLDNWVELRVQLLGRGAVLRNRSDAELVLRAYEAYGPDCVKHMDGDFAFVVWDRHNRQAFCARDRVGNRPFRYHWHKGTLAFASDQNALLQLPWVERKFNVGLAAEFLAWDMRSRDETFCENVLRLVAAHRLTVTAGKLTLDEYWSPLAARTHAPRSFEEHSEQYKALLFDVVRRQSRTNGPLAMSVSGGLDSSALFAVAHQLKVDGRLLASGINGYTLDMTGVDAGGNSDELRYARAVSAHVGQSISEVSPTCPPVSVYLERSYQLGDFFDLPNGAMIDGIRSKAVAAGSKAFMNGIGGDEWLNGSYVYAAEFFLRGRLKDFAFAAYDDIKEIGLDRGCRRTFSGLLSAFPESVNQWIRRVIYRTQNNSEWLTPEMQAIFNHRSKRPPAKQPINPRNLHQRKMIKHLTNASNIFFREIDERVNALAGLELRRPFWSAPIIEFCLSSPSEYLGKKSRSKLLHRHAMTGLLPDFVLSRSDKAEFSVVFGQQLTSLAEETVRTALQHRKGWIKSDSSTGIRLPSCVSPATDGALAWLLWYLLLCGAINDRIDDLH